MYLAGKYGQQSILSLSNDALIEMVIDNWLINCSKKSSDKEIVPGEEP